MSHFEYLRQNFGLCQLPQFTVLVDWGKNEKFWVIFKHCALLCLLFDIIYASLTFILTIRKICRNWERRSSFFPPFSGMDLLLSSGTGGVTGNAFVSSAAATKVDCLLLFLKSTLLFLTFLMRKHTVYKKLFVSMKLDLSSVGSNALKINRMLTFWRDKWNIRQIFVGWTFWHILQFLNSV